MPSPPRIFLPEVPYHVITRGSGKSVVFHDNADYEEYLRILLEAKLKYEVMIHHYALMPNHVHLVVCTTSENGSKFMRFLNLKYAKYSCRKRSKIGHVWKNRFKNLRIGSEAYLLACGNYIEMNPVRGRLTSTAAEWPYSSFNHYAHGKIDRIIDDSPFYITFGITADERQKEYQKWIGTTRA